MIPLFLTAALFLGPLVMASVNDVRIKLIMMPHYWAQSMRVSKGDVSKKETSSRLHCVFISGSNLVAQLRGGPVYGGVHFSRVHAADSGTILCCGCASVLLYNH